MTQVASLETHRWFLPPLSKFCVLVAKKHDRTAKEIWDVPVSVTNDGDVSVLVGSVTTSTAHQIGREAENGLIEGR